MFRVFSCLTTEHDWRLVVLAAVLCFFASLTAQSLFYRARLSRGRPRAYWSLAAGVAAGCGIWATHFIAMLAYEPGVPVAYNIGLTVLSLVVAVAMTAAGIGFAANGTERWRAPAGGAIVGIGVAFMHYLGMSALELPGRITWVPEIVVVSVTLGVVLSAASLAVAVRGTNTRSTVSAALLLALGIVSLHFTAMGAVEIIPDPTRIISAFSLRPTTLALAVAGVSLLMLALSLVGTMVDERFHSQRARLDAAINNMRHGLLMFDAQGQLLLYNRPYLELYGLSTKLANAGLRLRDLLRLRREVGTFGYDPDQFVHGIVDLCKIESNTMELPDGRTISIRNTPVQGGGWVSIHEDITERLRAEKELYRTKAFLDSVLENVPVTVVVKDPHDKRYIFVNRRGEDFFGVPRDQIIGKTAHDLFPAEEAEAIDERDDQVLVSGEEMLVENNPIETPGKGMRLVTTKRLAIRDREGNPQYMLGVLEDVTERKRAEQRIAHMALHDALTDLPNRASFTQQLGSILDGAAKAKESFAVLCIDLDRFKEINDVFGHAVGDKLLCEASLRLQTAAGDGFLARLGGDEFTVIQATGDQPADAAALAERLMAAVADDILIADHRLRVGLSIGIAIYPMDGIDSATLVGNADAALYRAKAQGRATICFFDSDMDQRLRDRRALQHELRTAILHDELVLYYQPQARVGGEIIGFEALVRWNHPGRGLLAAGAFIPIAEESSLIIPIGEWILREACREAASWPRPLQIAVNLSPIQFRHGDLPGLVHSVLLETGLSPHRLELEITEGVLIGDFSRAVSILRRLKSLGVRIAMDDFGTGYSSLSYLQSFPFDKIKIDSSFVANLDRNPQSAAIIRAVIALGRGLNLPVVAEGVETEYQLEFLSSEACNEVQGFLLGRPQPIERYDELTGRPPREAAAAYRLVG